LLAGVVVLGLVGGLWWTSGIDKRLSRQIADAKRPVIDLAEIVPAAWDRVCILSPYTNNEQAERVLGFAWDVQSKADIAADEGKVVLVFVRDREVVDYAEHNRGRGDLADLKPPCLERSAAKFVRHFGADGRLYLRPRS
jgi:hypothetical protein